jgi:glyoxylase-like metal-dependent hydrolase (beta-lactamase superfamily II)
MSDTQSTPPAILPVVRSFHHADSGTWTHVIVDPATREAAIVDAVLDFDAASGRIRTDSAQRVLEYVETARLRVGWVLETHAHADHLSAGAWLRERTGAVLAVGAGIVDVQRTFKRILELGDFPADGSEFDRLFADGETFGIGKLEARVIATPGHTPDSVTYAIGDVLVVGDTLFAPACGTARCDFPGGDAAELYRSIRKLYTFPDDTRVLLCHDYPAAGAAPLAETSVADEKRANTHLAAATSAETYVEFRKSRDAKLAVPRLLWPAIQFNIRGGRLPPCGEDGRTFFKLPVAFAEA